MLELYSHFLDVGDVVKCVILDVPWRVNDYTKSEVSCSLDCFDVC